MSIGVLWYMLRQIERLGSVELTLGISKSLAIPISTKISYQWQLTILSNNRVNKIWTFSSNHCNFQIMILIKTNQLIIYREIVIFACHYLNRYWSLWGIHNDWQYQIRSSMFTGWHCFRILEMVLRNKAACFESRYWRWYPKSSKGSV